MPAPTAGEGEGGERGRGGGVASGNWPARVGWPVESESELVNFNYLNYNTKHFYLSICNIYLYIYLYKYMIHISVIFNICILRVHV